MGLWAKYTLVASERTVLQIFWAGLDCEAIDQGPFYPVSLLSKCVGEGARDKICMEEVWERH